MFCNAAGSHSICPRDSVIDQRVIIRKKCLVYLVSMGTACLMAALAPRNGNPLHKASLTPHSGCAARNRRPTGLADEGRWVGGAKMQMSSVASGGGRVGREPWSQWAFPCVPPARGMRANPTEASGLECALSNSPLLQTPLSQWTFP